MKKQLLPLIASTLMLASSFGAAHAQQEGAGAMMQSDQPGGRMMRQHGAEEDEEGPQRRQPRHGMRGMMAPHMFTMIMIMMDTNNDGTLSLEEVQAVHARMFNYADTDDDGKLTVEEMQRFFRGHQGDSDE